MSDDRVIEYLRTRARVEPKPELVARVMAAVEAAPAARSPFAMFLPAVAITGAVAVAIALALILGQGPSVGPTPTESAEAIPSPATFDELQAAVESGIDTLREAPGVEGLGTSSTLGELGAATWFSWRPSGDQIVISRSDVDVTETAWWLEPGGEPPARGENVTTRIQLLVGDESFVTEGDDWVVGAREDAPPALAFATAILDGDPLANEAIISNPLGGEVTVVHNPDGTTTWNATAPYRDGRASAEYLIAADGALVSWSFELVDVTPAVDDTQFATFQRMEFIRLPNAAPIEAPDSDAVPDPADLGLPPDFPMQAAP